MLKRDGLYSYLAKPSPKGDAMWLDTVIGLSIVYLLWNYHRRIKKLERRFANQNNHDEKLNSEIEKESRELLDMAAPLKK